MKEKLKIFFTIILSLIIVTNNFPVLASSHREAPFITKTPKVDGTDFYLFNSYEDGRSDYVTLIANYIPLQDAYGGPNYFTLDTQAVYEIHCDNTGDSVEDITFQFMAKNTSKDLALEIGEDKQKISIPVIIAGILGPKRNDTASLNVEETYTLNLINGPRRKSKGSPVVDATSGSTEFKKPVDNVGNKSIPNYEEYANDHIYEVKIPGCAQNGKVFVGQRKEGFVVNLGETFDLVNYNPAGATDSRFNTIDDKNVTTFALEIPKSCLALPNSPTIGCWTTASLPKVQNNDPNQQRGKGPLVQVSRLSHPLVNEVVIGLKDKDKFNASEPKNDAQFLHYVTNPTLPALLELLFSDAGVKAPTVSRSDLVSVFLTGVDGLNMTTGVGEYMRLNTSISAISAKDQNTLGVIAGDNAGYPNGRRPGDDVIDIALRAVLGVLLPEDQAPAGKVPATDGASVSASDFDEVFPYLKTPIAGSPDTRASN